MTQVRIKIGRNAGEVHEVPYHIAAQMLLDGRAERPDAPLPDAAPVATDPEPVAEVPVRVQSHSAKSKKAKRK